MNILRQTAAVTAMSLRGLSQRLGASCVIVVGTMGVVGVLVSVLTMSGSLTGALIDAGRADRAVVLRAGANSETASTLSLESAATIAGAPGVARTKAGDPSAVREIFSSINLARRSNSSLAGIVVHGVSKEGFDVRPEVQILEGRTFTPGLHELIVGRSVQIEFAGVEIGKSVELRGTPWTVVGTFVSGDVLESGLLGDTDTLLSTYGRTAINNIVVRLESPDSFDQFKVALTSDPSLSVDVFTEPEFRKEDAKDLEQLFFFVTTVVSGIMAFGALFAALNTMYSAVSARTVEIATLRAIGFGPSGIVVSVLIEALLLSALGALGGALVSWLLFNGNTFSIGGTTGSIVTQMNVTTDIIVTGVLWACAVSLVGALLPSLRAARLPVATALRAV